MDEQCEKEGHDFRVEISKEQALEFNKDKAYVERQYGENSTLWFDSDYCNRCRERREVSNADK